MPLFERSVFDDVQVEDTKAVLLARATRNLDFEHRQLRERVAARSGISVIEFNSLVLADQAKGTLTPRVLAGYLHMSTSATTAVIDRLERLHMLERRPHPTDRRSSELQVLPEGRRVAHTISRSYVASMEAVVTQCRSDADLHRLLEHLQRLTTAVSRADEGIDEAGAAVRA